MDSSSRARIRSIVSPRGDASPVTQFSIEQIIHPRGPVVRVDAAAPAKAVAPAA